MGNLGFQKLAAAVALGFGVSAAWALLPVSTVDEHNNDPEYDTVYLYNSADWTWPLVDTPDEFNNNALAYILQELGLLDDNGQLSADILNCMILAEDGETIVGFHSPDGTQAAYNASYPGQLAGLGVTGHAWRKVNDGGEFHIIKHGAENTSRGIQGGGIHLDESEPYDGFGDGTNGHYHRSDRNWGPYPLEERPDAGITVRLNSCFSAHDPDGEEGPMRSVTESAEDVPGVDHAEGHEQETYVDLTLTIVPADKSAEAMDALRIWARLDGYPPQPTDGTDRGPTTDADILEWIADMPGLYRAAMVQNVLNAFFHPSGSVIARFHYHKEEAAPGEDVGGCYHVPDDVPADTGGRISYQYRYEFEAAYLDVEPESLEFPTLLHINLLGDPPDPPSGYSRGSGAFLFGRFGGSPFLSPATLGFGFYCPVEDAVAYRYSQTDEAWLPVDDAVVFDQTTDTVQITTTQLGLYSVFTPTPSIPTVSEWGSVVITLIVLTLGIGTLVVRRRSVAA